jgi:hypothetical protein
MEVAPDAIPGLTLRLYQSRFLIGLSEFGGKYQKSQNPLVLSPDVS